MKNRNVKIARDQQLLARKLVLMDRLAKLFARANAHLEQLCGLVELSDNGKSAGRYHIDCMLITAESKTYYFTFGYSQAKSVEHPFFIRLNEDWFDGTKLVTDDRWLYASLSQAMGCQGEFLAQGISVAMSQIELSRAA